MNIGCMFQIHLHQIMIRLMIGFCISFNGIRTETFSFNVYNRVSEVVYSTTNIIDLECFLNNNGWDGKLS